MDNQVERISIEVAQEGGFVLYVSKNVSTKLYFSGGLEDCLRHIKLLLSGHHRIGEKSMETNLKAGPDR